MSVAEQITRLNTAKADIKTAIESHSITVPSDAHIDTYDDYIKQIGDSTYWTHDWKFKRPADWPNLDIFDIENNPNTFVISFDCRDRIADPNLIDYYALQSNNKNFTIERGVVTNGQFVVNETINGEDLPRTGGTTGNWYFYQLLPRDEGDYVVYKVKAKTTGIIYMYSTGNASNILNPLLDNVSGLGKQWNSKAIEIHCNWPGLYYMPCPRSPLLRNYKCITSKYSTYYTGYICMQDCSQLEYIDTSKWNDFNFKQLNASFTRMSSLRKIDLSRFSFGASSLQDTFCYDFMLEELSINHWNTSNVTNMATCFAYCESLKELDISNWSTGNVTTMNGMFRRMKSLTTLDIQNFNTAKVTDMSYMFAELFNCKEILLGNTFSFAACTTTVGMFQWCISMNYCPLSGKVFSSTNITNIQNMFYRCHGLVEMDMSGWNLSKVTNVNNTSYVFYECRKINKVILPATLIVMHANIFTNCNNLRTIIINATTPPTWAVTTAYLNQLHPNYKIYVPMESVNSYKAASGWANAASHIYSINELT